MKAPQVPPFVRVADALRPALERIASQNPAAAAAAMPKRKRYRGKYPNRICEVWSARGDVGRCYFKTNRGDVYTSLARDTKGEFPKCGAEASAYPLAALFRSAEGV